MRTLKRKQQWNTLLRIIIFDTTLRDGEQCPGASMSLRQKLEIARQLKRLRVDVIEAGFPVISDGDFKAVQAIAREIKGPIICGLARCVNKDIDRAAEALKPAGKKARIHVFVGTSPIHRGTLGTGKTKEEVLSMAVAGVTRAKSYVADVQFSAMDASRTEPDFLIAICKAAVAAGATTINVPDTVGRMLPDDMLVMIRNLLREIPELQSGKVVLSVHCHDDLGHAVANSIEALRAGALQVECTVNGIGERAGNASLEEIVMIINTRSDRFSAKKCAVRTTEILKTSKLVARMSGLPVQRSKAIVGENSFAHASGIHQDGQLKNRRAFEIMDPTDIGWGGTELPLTKHSGRAAVAARLRHLGFKLNDSEVSAIFARFKEIGDRKKFVYDDDLCSLVEGHITKIPETWSLLYLSVTTQTGGIPTATVRLKNCTGEPQDAGTGDGPIDAALRTIDRLTKTRGRLVTYSVSAVSQGKDALGEVLVEVDFGNGTIIKGRGAHTDVIEASARAYLNAVNRHLQSNGKGK
ncbi:MAG: 2-isopropylmalate synthase [bacterium]|nr:2-isopropylmalate synthase [bacterium]